MGTIKTYRSPHQKTAEEIKAAQPAVVAVAWLETEKFNHQEHKDSASPRLGGSTQGTK